MTVKATWKGKMSFDSVASNGLHLPMDTSVEQGGENNGFKPVELLLVSLAGCTAMDVISILHKKKQDVTGFEVSVSGERAEDHPRVYTHIMVNYQVTGKNIEKAAVERAVELSETKYCSAINTLNKTAVIEHTITIANSN